MPGCDIIIPVWNQLNDTSACVESIEKNTSSPYRLIIIDNASSDETARYLDGLKEKNVSGVMLIRNETNEGFVKAVNRGIQASSAEYVCILNNDTLVTDNWLTEMIGVMESDPLIGIVNPSSNNLGQRPLPGEPIDAYAKKLKAESGMFVELGAAIGFCMLIRREMIDKIGFFDEIYGRGNFEDTDFSRRAVKEGYKCVRACGAYVYHKESTSFKKIKSFEEDFNRNREIFEFRWGRPKRIAYVLDSCDANTLKSINLDSVRLARGGNWVWYYLKERLRLPVHSNIISVELPQKGFYIKALFHILKKKKKFNEIFVGNAGFGRLLEAIVFIHNARIKYY